ncbi:MAG: hypothetical protein FJY18_08365, partial [Bacteroidetes bacterium]|nr:hypothetical protein [Bacteroidota bacterium]
NQSICAPNSYLFNGQSYSTSGTYTATLTNAAGCDSVITLNLTVNQSLGDSVASVNVGIVQATPGSIVSVPVVAQSLVDVSSFQFGLYFDAGVLTYQNVRSGNSLANQVVLPALTGNRVDVAYIDFSGSGFSACGDTILWLDFTYSVQGGISPLVWDLSFTQVSGLSGNTIADLRLRDGMVYGTPVTTPVPSTNGNQSVCEFSDAAFVVNGIGITTYQWMVSTDGGSSFVSLVNGNGIAGAQSDSLVLTSVLSGMNGNIYMCRVNGTGGSVASLVQRLDVRPLTTIVVQLSVSPSGVQCAGTSVTYSVQNMTVTTPAYRWLVNGALVGTGTSLVRADLAQGDVVAVEINSSMECIVASASVVAQVSALPELQMVTGGGSYCPGTGGVSIALSGSQAGVRYYLLNNGMNTGDTLMGTGVALSFNGVIPVGYYTVRAVNSNGCLQTMSGVVSVSVLSGVQATVTSDTFVYAGGSVQLQASGGATYHWLPSAGLSSVSLANPVASPAASTLYSVIVTNVFGCSDTLEVRVDVIPLPEVNAGADMSVCINSGLVSLTGTPSGGVWTGQGIATGTTQFDPQSAGVGIWPVVYGVNFSGVLVTDTLLIQVAPVSSMTLVIVLCQPNTYQVGTSVYYQTGLYSDTLINQFGCDSVVSLNLTVNPVSTSTVNAQICSSSTYTLGTQTFDSAGVYQIVLANGQGCDSVITLNLSVIQPSSSTINQSICAPNSYLFNGQSYSTSGTYTATLTNAAGCDSVVTLNLTVNQQVLFAISLNGTTYGAQSGGHTIPACSNNNYSFTLAGISAGTLPLVGTVRVWDGAIGTGTPGPIFTGTINNIGD